MILGTMGRFVPSSDFSALFAKYMFCELHIWMPSQIGSSVKTLSCMRNTGKPVINRYIDGCLSLLLHKLANEEIKTLHLFDRVKDY